MMMDVIWIGNKVANGIDGTRVCCDTDWLNQYCRVYIMSGNERVAGTTTIYEQETGL